MPKKTLKISLQNQNEGSKGDSNAVHQGKSTANHGKKEDTVIVLEGGRGETPKDSKKKKFFLFERLDKTLYNTRSALKKLLLAAAAAIFSLVLFLIVFLRVSINFEFSLGLSWLLNIACISGLSSLMLIMGEKRVVSRFLTAKVAAAYCILGAIMLISVVVTSKNKGQFLNILVGLLEIAMFIICFGILIF